ncbi:MAG: DNA polymerase I [Candidatus Edwardsbacteria bacterium]|jgi:DNA polymerase-1|nr:DNA polymerase I [Candidatus Edwardsbacteria bacterium]
MPKLMLIDGTALAYRAYYAYIRSPLINSKGENTSASYGFTSTMLGLLREHKPDYLAVGFDVHAPTFRHEKYDQYKAQRPPMPEDLRPQIPRIKEILGAMSVPVLEKAGFEADDVLAGLAKQAERKGWTTYIVTGDKDFLQIVGERIKVVRPRGGKSEETVFGPREVEAEWGVEPERIVDVLALAGDASDNVPGVPGIGPKTAVELVRQFGSFDEVYRHLDRVAKPRIRKLLEDNKAQAELSKELVTLHLAQLPGVALGDLKAHEPDRERMAGLFKDLEFGSLYREFAAGQVRKLESQAVRTAAEAESLDARVRKSGELCFELEDKDGGAARMAVFADGQPWIAEAKLLPTFKPLFENPKVAKTVHDLKRAVRLLAGAGIELAGTVFDTMLASYLIDPSGRGHASLEALATEHLGVSLRPPSNGKKAQTELSFETNDKEALQLLARRADAVAALKQQFAPKLADAGLRDLFDGVEVPLAGVLARMESAGVLLDTGLFAEMSKDLERQVAKIEKSIYRQAGEEFNINSPKQLGAILFDKLKVGKPRKTKTGYSTDVDVLTRLAVAHELPQLVLDYRQLFKLKSTYVDALPLAADPDTHRLHTTFNQAVTETGRLSSSDPNLQNIPMREGVGREIRKGFVAPKGCVLLSADYSQIELRLVAHLSGDGALHKAFQAGRDIHTETASAVFGVKGNEVTPDMRRKAKAINFGIVYGMGPYGLSQQLGIPVEEAAQFIAQYFANFPQVQAWIALTVAQARKDGFVCTMLGRRRYLPEIASDNGQRRAFAERTAVNTPIQGTAADLIKLAMVNLDRLFAEQQLKSRMLLQVHDELLFEVAQHELAEVKKLVKREMEGAVELSVPVVVEIGTGKNWFEAH